MSSNVRQERPSYEQWKALMNQRPIDPYTRELWAKIQYAKRDRKAA